MPSTQKYQDRYLSADIKLQKSTDFIFLSFHKDILMKIKNIYSF